MSGMRHAWIGFSVQETRLFGGRLRSVYWYPLVWLEVFSSFRKVLGRSFAEGVISNPLCRVGHFQSCSPRLFLPVK